ncbi:MAG: long-chain fatty acid--CoA ligase [Myxococcales bacterium]|nr:MAG: long-chain fatty acid--CoA ligase [Myxococcales bacterium]
MTLFERPWQKHYDAHVPKSLEYPRLTIYEFLERTALKQPDDPALEFFGRQTSYSELFVKVDRFAAGLWEMGLRPRDRVILLLPNCPQFVVAYLAVMKIGAVAVMANPLNVERELIFKFKDCGAETLIALDLLSFRVNKVKAEVPLKRIIYTRLQDEMPFPISLVFPFVARKTSPKPEIDWDGRTRWMKDVMIAETTLPDWREQAISPDEMAVLIYSGGTTGVSKGIMLSHYALVCNAMQVGAWGELRNGDSFLAVLPFFHGFGLSVGLNATLSKGGRLVILPKFDAKLLLKTIHEARPTFFAGVPTMFIAMKELPDFRKYDISSLRAIFCGAAPMPLEVMREFEELAGAPLIEGFGLTEIVTAICCNPMHGVRKPGTVGIPFPDIDARIVDLETGTRDVAEGKEGELILKGPDMMLGYLNQPAATAETIQNGWLYTGDICTRDADGYIRVVDRKKDLVIVSGFNVFPREIDEVLHQHPKVQDAVAVGLPHPVKGEYLKAYVVAKAGQAIDPNEVLAFLKERLTPYMVPKEVEVRDDLPKSMIGKVLRRALKEEEMAKSKAAQS